MESTYKKVGNYLYDPAKPLGEGSFGKIYLAFEKESKSKVAVRVIPMALITPNEEKTKEKILKEVQTLHQLKGVHVVQLVAAQQTPNNLYIFMDYCDGGNLAQRLEKEKKISENEACGIIKQIAKAFCDLMQIDGEKTTLMHRDIKPSNILFHQGITKIADFGLAKAIDDGDKEKKLKHTLLKTSAYQAPQILSEGFYSAKCDIWSTGEVFYQMLFGKRPWELDGQNQKEQSQREILERILFKPLTFPGQISDDTKDLLKRMLKIDETERIWWNEVLQHKALNKYKKNESNDLTFEPSDIVIIDDDEKKINP